MASGRLYCKRQGNNGGDYCVAIRDDKLILTLPLDNDPTQLWYKEGSNASGFMLLSKSAGKAVQYSCVGDQLRVVNKPYYRDQSVLWTESGDVGDGYTFLRTHSDAGLVMDAWEGKIFDGSSVSIYPNSNSDNEYWKLVSYSPSTNTPTNNNQNYQKLYCKQQGPDGDYCVAVRYDKLILTRPNDSDPSQLWYKESYYNGFMLVNKATNKPVQYNGVGDQLQLVNKPNGQDQSVLWTESGDVGGGYTFIRTQGDVGVVMDAWEGKIFDGSIVSIYPNSNSDNEYWKLTSYAPSTHTQTHTPTNNNHNYQKLYCKQQGPEGDYCVAVRYDKLILTRPNDSDPSQLWYKENYNNGFMLVNKATNKPVQYIGVGDQLQLVNKPNGPDQSVLWTESGDVGEGYTFIRTQADVGVVMDAWEGKIFDGSIVSIYPNSNSDNEYWKLTSYAPTLAPSSNHHSYQKLYCRKQGPDGDYCVAVRGDKLILTRPSSDSTQLWYKDNYSNGFMLVNKATNKAVQYNGVGDQLQLVNKPNYPDQSVLWTESEDVGEGYTFLRTQSDVGVVMDAWEGKIFNGTIVSIYPNSDSDNEHWKLA